MKRILTAAAAVLLCACSVQAETPVQTASQPVLSETVVQTEETEQPAQQQTETSTDASQTETSTEASQSEVQYTCEDAADKILSDVDFPTMMKVDNAKISDYLGADVPESADAAMYICGSGGFADELFIIKTDDSSAYSENARKRINDRMKDFEDYDPDESAKLEDALVLDTGGYFIYFVTNDNDRCEEIVRDMLLG